MVVSALVAWGAAAGLCLCFGTLLRTRDARWRVLLWGWAIAAGLSALMALVQFFDQTLPFAPWINYAGLGQAFGNLRQRNQLATLCSMGLVLLWWWAQHLPRAPQGQSGAGVVLSFPLALGLAAGAALVSAADAATSSRTGLLQVLLLLALAWVWRLAHTGNRHGLWLTLWALVCYAAAAVLLPRLAGFEGSVFNRLNEAVDCSSRVSLWRNVLYLIAQKPLGGWGWGELDYAHFMALYDTPLAGTRFCEILDNAHNLPLHVAVELGLPVALLAGGGLLWALRRMQPWREPVPERQLAWAVLAMIGLHSLLEYPLWYGPFQIAALGCLWILWAFAPAGVALDPTKAEAPWAWLAVAGALALVCAAASWNYRAMSQLYLSVEQRAPAYRESTFTKVHDAWFFGDHVAFAELSVTPIEPENAQYVMELGERMLHFSPEAKVVEKVLDAAVLLQRADKVALYAPRFAAAFPQDYERWRAGNAEAGVEKLQH